MKSSSREKQISQPGSERKWQGSIKLKSNEPEAWGVADSPDGLYLITIRGRDSEDGLSRVLIYIFRGREVVDKPICEFKVDCLMAPRKQSFVINKLVDLIATDVLNPWELRDRVMVYTDFYDLYPAEPIFGKKRRWKGVWNPQR